MIIILTFSDLYLVRAVKKSNTVDGLKWTGCKRIPIQVRGVPNFRVDLQPIEFIPFGRPRARTELWFRTDEVLFLNV